MITDESIWEFLERNAGSIDLPDIQGLLKRSYDMLKELQWEWNDPLDGHICQICGGMNEDNDNATIGHKLDCSLALLLKDLKVVISE